MQLYSPGGKEWAGQRDSRGGHGLVELSGMDWGATVNPEEGGTAFTLLSLIPLLPLPQRWEPSQGHSAWRVWRRLSA